MPRQRSPPGCHHWCAARRRRSSSVADNVDALERGTSQALNERGRSETRRRWRGTAAVHLDGGDDRRLERFLMLLEIQCDLFVAQPWEQWKDDEPGRDGHDGEDRYDATGEYRRVGVLEVAHRVRCRREDDPARGHRDRGATQRYLGAIAIANASYDAE